jgi:IclR family transcriptional regulator, mhp operon transcriptional activator
VTHNDDARGVTRTLAVLRALNTHNGATVTQLSRVTRISRPALYRILDALVHNGYVAADPDRKTYCLTYLVRSLSDGFRDEHWISEIAGPVMNDLQRRVLWPTDLATFANYEMRLRDTTRRRSPLVIDRSAVGAQLSFLRSALGLAYLAHCPASERGAILEMLQRPGHPDHGLASDTVRVLRLLREVRRRGYGWRFKGADTPENDARSQTATIAVPVYGEAGVVATIGITFFASVLSIQEAARRHLGDLRAAARAIELAMRH